VAVYWKVSSPRDSIVGRSLESGPARAGCAQPRRNDLATLRPRALVVAERIDMTAMEAAADRWTREQHHHQRASGWRWTRELFIQTARHGLHFLGRLEVPKLRSYPLRAG
jgi:hypothetical protein